MRASFLIATLAAAAAAGAARAEPILFLVAEPRPVHGDSYVLPLTNPADIQHARDLIRLGTTAGRTIAVARIEAGGDGINRDYLAQGLPPWSWHVTEFLGFADFAIELCDGWPTFVERDVAGWIENTRGTICFWTYTVVAEIGLAGVAVPEPGGLALLALGAGGLVICSWRCRRARRERRS